MDAIIRKRLPTRNSPLLASCMYKLLRLHPNIVIPIIVLAVVEIQSVPRLRLELDPSDSETLSGEMTVSICSLSPCPFVSNLLGLQCWLVRPTATVHTIIIPSRTLLSNLGWRDYNRTQYLWVVFFRVCSARSLNCMEIQSILLMYSKILHFAFIFVGTKMRDFLLYYSKVSVVHVT